MISGCFEAVSLTCLSRQFVSSRAKTRDITGEPQRIVWRLKRVTERKKLDDATTMTSMGTIDCKTH